MRNQNLPSTSRGNGLQLSSPFDILHQRIDRMFDDLSSGFGMPRLAGDDMRLLPSLEMHEQDGKLLVNAELPGVEEKDIDISVDDDVLTISGEKRSEFEGKESDAYRTERSYGRFTRSVQLPFSVDPAKVDARFDKGVLKLSIDRPAEAMQKARKIPIRH
jgi:HSP20 family protein